MNKVLLNQTSTDDVEEDAARWGLYTVYHSHARWELP